MLPISIAQCLLWYHEVVHILIQDTPNAAMQLHSCDHTNVATVLEFSYRPTMLASPFLLVPDEAGVDISNISRSAD